MVNIVTHATRDQNSDVLFAQFVLETSLVDHSVHHLGYAETVPEVVERIVAVALLYAQLVWGIRKG